MLFSKADRTFKKYAKGGQVRRSTVTRAQRLSPIRLSIETPTFELVVNLKTAKALGLAIRQAVRDCADQLIE
jgi:hypothetical protein